MKFHSLIPLLLLPLSAIAQTCTPSGTVLNAATCNEADVNACFSAASNTTTAINIPSGTCGWSSQLTVTVPSGNTNLVLQGNTTVSCTGTAGTNTYSCTPTDNTVIVDNISGNFGVLQINGSASGSNPLFEATGLTIQNGSGGNKFQGLLLFYSNNSGSQLRIDHNHFNLTTGTSGTGWAGRLNGPWVGVGDHNVFDNASTSSTTSVAQDFMNSNTLNDSLGFGDGTWGVATGFGSSAFMFWENNVVNGGLFVDCVASGKFVVRYNTINSNSQSSSWIHNHGTESNNGRTRGCRAFEAYNNYFNVSGSGSALIGDAGGTALIWGNTINHTTATFLAVGDERNDGQHSQGPTPGDWGFCGENTLNPTGPVSNWDENVDTTGRACLDGIGRGQGTQTLNGANFPSALNSTTGTIAWPHEYLEPIYTWMNSIASTTPLTINSPATIANRDIYTDNASFTGATGTGFGTHAARLALSGCTAGPGGTYGTSPTGSYGVAYFETDTGLLDICTATNTWGVQFNPQYTYPHPLVTGGGVNLTVSIAGSGAAGSTVTGLNSSSGTYTSGTTIGPLTANPAVGATFTGWSVTGSALCSGATNPCPSFSITATTTVTATFTAASLVCGDPFESGPNFGGTYLFPSTPLPVNVAWTSPTPGCSMFMTLDGTAPNCTVGGSTIAYAPQNLTATQLILIKACQGGYTPSNQRGDTWTLNFTGLWNSLAGWSGNVCYLPSCNPGGTGTPVGTPTQTIKNFPINLSGSSMQMSFVANANSTNVLYPWKNPTICDLCTSFAADFEVYPVSSSNLGALELDTAFLFSVGLNREFMWGMQYCLLGSGCPGAHSSWDIWDQGTGTWIDTGITTPPNFGAWNHIQTTNHRVGNSQIFDTFTLNGTLHNLNTTETSSVLPGGWSSAVGFQFQQDASTPSGSQTYTMYLDEATFTTSAPTVSVAPSVTITPGVIIH